MIQPPKTLAEKIEWIRLIQSENVGPITFFHLLNRYHSASQALKEIPDLAKAGGRAKKITICPTAKAEQIYAQAEKTHTSLLFWGDAHYPFSLKHIYDPPPILYVKGSLSLLKKRNIAIIGARNASAAGRRLAYDFAYGLSQEGYNIVSGLARGIDHQAHQASLEKGAFGVIGNGLDIYYPEENKLLQDKIAESGLLISEYPFGCQPHARHFPRRNRIISGLCEGVVIIEAALKSGSLITADYALNQGRELFAVPGSPLDPRSHGTNNLLKQGAHLTQSVTDILNVLKMQKKIKEESCFYTPPSFTPPCNQEIEKARQILYPYLSPTPTCMNELMRLTHLSPGIFHMIILELELAGKIERQPGQKISFFHLEP